MRAYIYALSAAFPLPLSYSQHVLFFRIIILFSDVQYILYFLAVDIPHDDMSHWSVCALLYSGPARLLTIVLHIC